MSERLPPQPGRYPTPCMSDMNWEAIVLFLANAPTKKLRALGGQIDRQIQANRARWAVMDTNAEVPGAPTGGEDDTW